MSTVKPLTVPTKFLSQAITSASSTFKVNNIQGWGLDVLGNNVDLVAGDFGSQAYCVFRNNTGTIIEIMEFDPSTIASSSITILNRGLPFDGTTTPVTNYKLDWPAGTTIQFGTDVPQLLSIMSPSTINNEVVSGSATTFTLANTPVVGTVKVFGAGVRLTPGAGNDYTINGKNLTFINSYSSGSILADYCY